MAIQWGFIPSHITGLKSRQHAIWWKKVSVNTPRHSLSVPRLTKIIQWTNCGRPPLLLANYEVAATEGRSADIDELSINIFASNPSHHFLVLKSLTPHTCWSLSDARLSLDKFHNQGNMFSIFTTAHDLPIIAHMLAIYAQTHFQLLKAMARWCCVYSTLAPVIGQ